MRYTIFATALGLSVFTAQAEEIDSLKVGLQQDGRVVVPTNQILKPAGKQVTFPGRPVDLTLLGDGKWIVVKNMRNLLFIETETGKIQKTLPIRGGFGVVGMLASKGKVYVTDAGGRIWIATCNESNQYILGKPITLEKPPTEGVADGAGIAQLSEDRLVVATTRSNSVQIVNLVDTKVEQVVSVGVAPYMVVPIGNKIYVSNWGGDHPKPNDPQRPSSGTSVAIDPRTEVANRGSVSVLAAKDGKWRQHKSIAVGLHPCAMTTNAAGKRLYVANANSDTISVIDTATDLVVETISCRPEGRLPFGSGSNALVLSADGADLYVANGTNNCVAVVRLSATASGLAALGRPQNSFVKGLIPTGWYPGALAIDARSNKLIVANVKGHGSLSPRRASEKGMNSHDHLGSVSIIDLPDEKTLAAYTKEVNDNNRLGYSLAGLDEPRNGVKPIPVPLRHGEPSVFKNVIYIIKENRTYDQVFGDVKEGNGDPRLCIFGETVTPNHHKLAKEFTLLDNFYCSGILSADGHSWTDSAYVTDYLEKAFGSFPRSYPDDGRDPLAFAPTGFIWDNALKHKKTIRNYGEFIAEQSYSPKGVTWTDYYNDYLKGTRNTPIHIKVNKKSIEAFSHPTYPYFPLLVPDVYRANLFIEDLKQFEKTGVMPNLITMALPGDHTEGTTPDFPTPRAMVADNDLALGRIVEAVSRSRFWKETCILVVEDDPQGGFDHVDGHRTVALVISPYTKRRHVDHTNYNQTGMVKTVEMILGLPPMNQIDLAATPMRHCFVRDADLTAYHAADARIALNEMNPSLEKLSGKRLYWAKKSLELNLSEADKADEDTFNRIIWHSVRGEEPYPEELARHSDEEEAD